uniref:Uncharacterized protein n=1 Tax=Anopheles maculatus TaxID=74869 RepID=A0A182T231_9DIPT
HHVEHSLNDTDHLIEKEDSLTDAITNLEQSTETDPKNLDSSTLQMLKEHGIAFMPSDEGGSVITSAIKSGRKIVLSEAGKYALKETRNLHTQQHQQHQQQQQQHLQKQTFHPATSIHGTNITHTKTKTIKIIKKQSATSHLHHSHLHHHVHQSGTGATPTIKTNKVIKILSPEEFKQICGGEVGGVKRVSSSEYKKAVASSSVRVPIGGRSHVIPSSGGSMGTKLISKIVMTKSGQRFPVVGNAVQTKMGVSSSSSSSGSTVGIANGLSSGHNRHIITSADGVKRIRTATGMEIISALPTKLPQDTVVSVESSSAPRVGAVIHRVASLGNPSSISTKSIPSVSKTASGTTANLVVEVLERQLLELKKLIEDLRKQFELSQKQNEEYRSRVEKLEKEVQTLKQQQQGSSGTTAPGGSLVEIL